MRTGHAAVRPFIGKYTAPELLQRQHRRPCRAGELPLPAREDIVHIRFVFL